MSAEEVQEKPSTETAAAAEGETAKKAAEPVKVETKTAEPSTAPREPDGERRRRPKPSVGEAIVCRPLEVSVRDDRVEQAIRQLKNRMAREGILRELKNRRHYYKPSELKRIKSREAARRRRKQARQKTR